MLRICVAAAEAVAARLCVMAILALGDLIRACLATQLHTSLDHLENTRSAQWKAS